MNPQRFRVPREDRSLLSIPGLETAPRLVEENRVLFSLAQCSLHGRSLDELRTSARREALVAARSYTASLVQAVLPTSTSDSLIVGGHQPELFHVGVWAKNFTLAGVAKECQALALNLVIDNDTMNSTSNRMPIDTARPAQPWEEATIRDRELFRNFGTGVRDQIRSAWGFDPLIGNSWDAAIRQMELSERLYDGLTASRVHVERSWGLNNLELPMSRLCATEPFLWFAAHLLMRLPQLHASYNETVAEYRRAHRLRNQMQPVPNLDRADDWLEAPFWIWRRGDSQRGRLFARRNGSVCELRDQTEVFARLPLADTGPLDTAVAILSELPARGFRLRTRALTTTLFARVCLADLFVHGIGGARYDAMTDQLCTQLFGLEAPQFLTVSATLYLPLGGPFAATEATLRDLNHKIRDLTYNPDRHLNQVPAAAALIAGKNELLAAARALRDSNQLRGQLKPDQHRQLTSIRAALQVHTGALRAEYEAARATIRAQLAANALVRNREYAFVLYPEEQVREFLTPLSQQQP
jgi:hypothetical protein